MKIMKYKLNFTGYNFSFEKGFHDKQQVNYTSYKSARERGFFIADKTIGCQGMLFFVLVVYSSEKNVVGVYVFKDFIEVEKIYTQRWELMDLEAFKSWEEAYQHALKIRNQ